MNQTLQRRRGHYVGLRILLGLSIVGSMLLNERIVSSIVPVDPVLTVLIVMGFVRLALQRSAVAAILVRTAPWLWLIGLGSLASLFEVGATGWAFETLLQDVFCFGIVFAVAELVSHSHRLVGSSLAATALGMGLLIVSVLLGGEGYRPAGFFENPNYAAHYLVFAGCLIYVARWGNVGVRSVLLILAVGAVARTGSFGALSMALAGGAYVLAAGLRTQANVARKALLLTVLVFLCVSAWKAYGLIGRESLSLGNTITSYRLRNSSDVRYELWRDAVSLIPDHPFGVGPYGLFSRSLLERGTEVHSDVIAYLVERGVLGLVGLVGFAAALWRWAPPGGACRLLIVVFAVGGVFRETLHFRHAWIFLGVGLAVDLRRRAVAKCGTGVFASPRRSTEPELRKWHVARSSSETHHGTRLPV